MKKYLSVLLCLCMLSSCCFAQAKKENRDILFQRATIHSLIKGVFDGSMTLKDLKQHGDLGIGTYNTLDGEMVFLNGIFYQIKDDGTAIRPPLDTETPFACVTFFDPDNTLPLKTPMDYSGLKKYITDALPSRNIPYAIKITGTFKFVKTRSVPSQSKPYPLLTKIVEDQPVFEMQNIKGTLVGFRLPEDLKGVNVPGFHLHFLDAAHSRGGHLLDCEISDITIELDETCDLFLSFPRDKDFLSADLDGVSEKAIKSVESDRK